MRSGTLTMNESIYCLTESESENLQYEEHIFTEQWRKKNNEYASKMLKKYVGDILGRDREIHFHSLRHTFARRSLRERVSLHEEQSY